MIEQTIKDSERLAVVCQQLCLLVPGRAVEAEDIRRAGPASVVVIESRSDNGRFAADGDGNAE